MDLVISLLFGFALLVTTTTAAPHPQCTRPESDVPIFHIYGKCSPLAKPEPNSWFKTVINMASKDPERVAFLSSLVAQKTGVSAPIASGQQVLNIGNYLVRVQVGFPGQLMFMVLDTSYDTTWVPSSGCTGCSSSSTSTFSPNASTTFGPLDCGTAQCSQARGLSCPSTSTTTPCVFNQSYGGDSSIMATLGQDSLTLGTNVVPNYAFGCIRSISGKSIPPQGLLGLGRGPLSLLSQTGPLYGGVFSYCLPSLKSYYFSGSLKLGPEGQPRAIKTTPLLLNPHRSSLYYVNLTGVSVGRVNVGLPQEYLAFDPNTGAGTIIDSGTVITRLVEPVYNAIRDEFRKQVGGGAGASEFTTLGAFDTCFTVTQERVAPTVTLHFTGMDLKLPMENALIHSSAGSVACLSMASNVSWAGLNIIGNLQQQNLRILFDVANSRLGIAREICN